MFWEGNRSTALNMGPRNLRTVLTRLFRTQLRTRLENKLCNETAGKTRRHSIAISNPRRRLVTPPSECRWIAVLVYARYSMQNELTDPVTLTFDLWTPKHFSQGHSLYQVWTLRDHSVLSYAPDKQTNKQTDGLEHHTHADRHGRHA